MNKRLIIAVLGLTLSGCGGGGSGGGDGGHGSVSDAGATGTVSLGITDAPVDEAMQVVIEFTGVVFQHSSGQRQQFDFDPPRQINVLDLHSGNTAMLLENEQLAAGSYSSVRLMINAGPNSTGSFIERPIGTFPLIIPDSHMNRLQLANEFDVPAGGAANFTIDFDLRRSIQCSTGATDCQLQPSLRMVNNAMAGNIEGHVDAMLVHDPACSGSPAVYVYEGHDVGMMGMGSGSNRGNLVTTTMVVMDPASGEYRYSASYLNPGEYTVAFTCDGTGAGLGSQGMTTFMGTAEVNVMARMGMQHNFK